MALNATDTNTFIHEVRTHASNLDDAYNFLKINLARWTALDLGNTLDEGDFDSELHSEITITKLSSLLGTTLTALDTLYAAGHGTNIHNVRY